MCRTGGLWNDTLGLFEGEIPKRSLFQFTGHTEVSRKNENSVSLGLFLAIQRIFSGKGKRDHIAL
jgi:hypothetical protein